jgi:hypothetical protein
VRALVVAVLLAAGCRHSDGLTRHQRFQRAAGRFAAGMQERPAAEAHADCGADWDCPPLSRCYVPRYEVRGVCVKE